MDEIVIRLSLDEINQIIKSLANEPFKEVYELIGKINEQADEQIKKKDSLGKEN